MVYKRIELSQAISYGADTCIILIIYIGLACASKSSFVRCPAPSTSSLCACIAGGSAFLSPSGMWPHPTAARE